MRALPQVILAALELDDRNLARFALDEDFRAHRAAGQQRIADLNTATFTDE